MCQNKPLAVRASSNFVLSFIHYSLHWTKPTVTCVKCQNKPLAVRASSNFVLSSINYSLHWTKPTVTCVKCQDKPLAVRASSNFILSSINYSLGIEQSQQLTCVRFWRKLSAIQLILSSLSCALHLQGQLLTCLGCQGKGRVQTLSLTNYALHLHQRGTIHLRQVLG